MKWQLLLFDNYYAKYKLKISQEGGDSINSTIGSRYSRNVSYDRMKLTFKIGPKLTLRLFQLNNAYAWSLKKDKYFLIYKDLTWVNIFLRDRTTCQNSKKFKVG